jgi:hypothetical protein
MRHHFPPAPVLAPVSFHHQATGPQTSPPLSLRVNIAHHMSALVGRFLHSDQYEDLLCYMSSPRHSFHFASALPVNRDCESLPSETQSHYMDRYLSPLTNSSLHSQPLLPQATSIQHRDHYQQSHFRAKQVRRVKKRRADSIGADRTERPASVEAPINVRRPSLTVAIAAFPTVTLARATHISHKGRGHLRGRSSECRYSPMQ